MLTVSSPLMELEGVSAMLSMGTLLMDLEGARNALPVVEVVKSLLLPALPLLILLTSAMLGML